MIDGVPGSGERIVSLASMVHVLGLVGGLLYGLHAGVNLTIPARMTADGILSTVAAGSQPTTLLGVPFHIELLASVRQPPELPQLTGMTTGGELVRADVYDAFADRYGVRLGNMYGMTEVGVIATDLFGAHRPAVLPAPGLAVREEDGELHVSLPASPYLGDQDPSRWSDGWLHTKDAGSVDPRTGLVRVLGRRDSQVSVGGLKVDLTEVEHMLAALPEVAGGRGGARPRDRGVPGAGGRSRGARRGARNHHPAGRVQAPAAAARRRAATAHGHREARPRPSRAPRRRGRAGSDSGSTEDQADADRRPACQPHLIGRKPRP